MTSIDLEEKANLELSVGHLLAVWDVLANRISGSSFLDELSDDERRSIWALQDICERTLTSVGVAPLPEREWEALMSSARDHVRTIPVEFLE